MLFLKPRGRVCISSPGICAGWWLPWPTVLSRGDTMWHLGQGHKGTVSFSYVLGGLCLESQVATWAGLPCGPQTSQCSPTLEFPQLLPQTRSRDTPPLLCPFQVPDPQNLWPPSMVMDSNHYILSCLLHCNDDQNRATLDVYKQHFWTCVGGQSTVPLTSGLTQTSPDARKPALK